MFNTSKAKKYQYSFSGKTNLHVNVSFTSLLIITQAEKEPD